MLFVHSTGSRTEGDRQACRQAVKQANQSKGKEAVPLSEPNRIERRRCPNHLPLRPMRVFARAASGEIGRERAQRVARPQVKISPLGPHAAERRGFPWWLDGSADRCIPHRGVRRTTSGRLGGPSGPPCAWGVQPRYPVPAFGSPPSRAQIWPLTPSFSFRRLPLVESHDRPRGTVAAVGMIRWIVRPHRSIGGGPARPPPGPAR